MSGNVWMFSDEIDDEDLEFMSHDYVTYNMACEYYRLGIKPVVRMAHEAGAVYKIGKKVLIRRSIRTKIERTELSERECYLLELAQTGRSSQLNDMIDIFSNTETYISGTGESSGRYGAVTEQ